MANAKHPNAAHSAHHSAPHSVELSVEVAIADKKTRIVPLREPSWQDIEWFQALTDESALVRTRKMIHRLSGLDEEAILALPWRDGQKLDAAVADFFTETGA